MFYWRLLGCDITYLLYYVCIYFIACRNQLSYATLHFEYPARASFSLSASCREATKEDWERALAEEKRERKIFSTSEKKKSKKTILSY